MYNRYLPVFCCCINDAYLGRLSTQNNPLAKRHCFAHQLYCSKIQPFNIFILQVYGIKKIYYWDSRWNIRSYYVFEYRWWRVKKKKPSSAFMYLRFVVVVRNGNIAAINLGRPYCSWYNISRGTTVYQHGHRCIGAIGGGGGGIVCQFFFKPHFSLKYQLSRSVLLK